MKIGMIGDYNPEYPSQLATNQAFLHAAAKYGNTVAHEWIPTASIRARIDTIAKTYQGFWIGPGSPDSADGVRTIIQYARENNVPLIGTCGGFQLIIVEYAQNVLQLQDAGHEEQNPDAEQLVINKLACSLAGQSGEIILHRPSQVADIYRKTHVIEQFRCHYGLNPEYEALIEGAGLKFVGTDAIGRPRVVELPEHPFFVGTLFVPQLHSTPDAPHCLVEAFIEAVIRRSSRSMSTE